VRFSAFDNLSLFGRLTQARCDNLSKRRDLGERRDRLSRRKQSRIDARRTDRPRSSAAANRSGARGNRGIHASCDWSIIGRARGFFYPLLHCEGETQYGPEETLKQKIEEFRPRTTNSPRSSARSLSTRSRSIRPSAGPGHPLPGDGHLLLDRRKASASGQDDSGDVRGASEGARLHVPHGRVVLVLPADGRSADAGAGR